MAHAAAHKISDDMRRCIDVCLECHRACLEMVLHCLQVGGAHADAPHIRLLMDCAEICQTSANFMLRDSELHGETCAACADVCERCARDCEQFGDDPMMRACVEICRRCAESCRKMAGGRTFARAA